jgi:inorganic pyrophosphatase
MIHPWHDISPAIDGHPLPGHFRAVIEIPKGSSNKYELDKPSGFLRLDRVLWSAVYYPANYGFIPQTYAEDDDPLDVLVFSSEEVPPLTICDARAVGLMTMIDEGQKDHKIVAVLTGDPEYAEMTDAEQFPSHVLKVLRRFFQDYKTLEDKQVEVDAVQPSEAAHDVINEALELYSKERRAGRLAGTT